MLELHHLSSASEKNAQRAMTAEMVKEWRVYVFVPKALNVTSYLIDPFLTVKTQIDQTCIIWLFCNIKLYIIYYCSESGIAWYLPNRF